MSKYFSNFCTRYTDSISIDRQTREFTDLEFVHGEERAEFGVANVDSLVSTCSAVRGRSIGLYQSTTPTEVQHIDD